MTSLLVEFRDNELEVISSVAEYYGVSVGEYIVVAALRDAIEESLVMLKDVYEMEPSHG